MLREDRQLWLLIAPFALMLLFGCSSTGSQAVRLGLKLAPATLGASLSLQQHLTIRRGDVTDEMDAALEIDPQRIDLVGLVLGQRVMALHYDGRELQTWRHALVPAALRGEDVLEDLQLTLWPIEPLRSALPDGYSIEDSGLRRTLSLADVPVMIIEYSGEPRWNGTIELVNVRYDYRLTIQSVSTGMPR